MVDAALVGYGAPLRTIALTSAAMVCFAANSLLTRAALGEGRLDATTFMAVRLLTGALSLFALTRLRPRAAAERGSWPGILALAGYAVFFTLAYVRIGAAVGALVLFGSVQVTMIGTGLVRGERPARVDWLGLALAVGGLLVFVPPGVTAPDPLGVASMVAAGASWGAYSLLGRSSRDPLGATAGNFSGAALIAGALALASPQARHVTPSGLVMATASGAIASGLGYTIWYAVLPALTAWRAAVVQLVVPVLTALTATALLREPLTGRILLATALIVSGVTMTALPALHRVRSPR